MLLQFCVIIVFCVTIDSIHSQGYKYCPELNGWIKAHRVMLTWYQAEKFCNYEGAELASPTNLNMLKEMQSLLLVNNSTKNNYIGVAARYHIDFYQTSRGMSIEEMPVLDILHTADSRINGCLAMNRQEIWSLPCDTRLGYICFRERKGNEELTRCGTFDTDYHYIQEMGVCYKLHKEKMYWHDCFFACAAEGGYLAIDERLNFVTYFSSKNISRSSGHATDDFVFIGFKKYVIQNEPKWISMQGETFTDSINAYGTEVFRNGECAVYNTNNSNFYSAACDEKFSCLCAMNPNIIRFSPPEKKETGGAKF